MATPAEIEESLAKAQPLFTKMNQRYNAENNRWINEIAMLERRVESLYEDVDLGNGDKIAVRTALSEEEAAEYQALEQRKRQDGVSVDEISEITYRQLELMTANPILTADWFRSNRDKWPVNDALMVVAGFAENQIRIQRERINNLKKFRGE